ncbi:TPA: hypothetical protein ACH3X3_008229 [Trebouxia sp. C0006]
MGSDCHVHRWSYFDHQVANPALQVINIAEQHLSFLSICTPELGDCQAASTPLLSTSVPESGTGGHLCDTASTLIPGVASMPDQGAFDPMQRSQYTFRLVQICTPEPCKIVLMTDKRKRRLLCMVQVYKSCVDGLCTYQAFYRICCKQAGNKFTMLSGLDKQLLVKLGGLDTSVPSAWQSAAKLSSLPRCQLLCWLHLRTSGPGQTA